MSSPRSNRNIPAIPATMFATDLHPAVIRLKEGVESLAGIRGNPMDRAATLQDLVDLGLVTLQTVQGKLQ